MNDDFTKMILELARDRQDIQNALIKSADISKQGYSIPTVHYSKALDEVTDIHYGHIDYDLTEAQREQLIKNIKKIDSMTVGQLAKMCNYARIALRLKEAEGQELTDPERTIRDIDVTMLALTIATHYPKVIGRTKPIEGKPAGYTTPEEYEKAREEILANVNVY